MLERSSHQPSSVLTAHAVGLVDLRALRGEAGGDFADDRELAAFVDLKAHLRGGDRDRHFAFQLGQRLAALADRADQANRGVERVVEPYQRCLKKMWPLISPASGRRFPSSST